MAIAAMISRQLSRQEDQMDDLPRQAVAAKRHRAAARPRPRQPRPAPATPAPAPPDYWPVGGDLVFWVSGAQSRWFPWQRA